MSADLVAIERSPWAAADQLWANTGLAPADFSTPVLGLIFLRYADERFGAKQAELTKGGLKPNDLDPDDYQVDGVLYLPDEARFSHLVSLAEGANLGRSINNAMALIEAENEDSDARTFTSRDMRMAWGMVVNAGIRLFTHLRRRS